MEDEDDRSPDGVCGHHDRLDSSRRHECGGVGGRQGRWSPVAHVGTVTASRCTLLPGSGDVRLGDMEDQLGSTPGSVRSVTSLVTGANTGLGRATARALAARGDRVILACRSEASTRPVIDEIATATGNDALEYLHLDLGDLQSVADAAASLVERADPIDVLVANAGVAGQRGETSDGFELAFGINHLGHFLFVTELLDNGILGGRTPDGGPARLVVVSSGSHNEAKGIDLDSLQRPTKSISGLPEYAVSKLANVLFTQEVARRVSPGELFAVALHPGNLIGTDVTRRLPKPLHALMKRIRPSPEVGARTSVMCATSMDVLDHNGAYYSVENLDTASPVATLELADALWTKSEEWVGPFRTQSRTG